MAADLALLEAQTVAGALAGAPVELCRLDAGGRNSRIYRVQAGERVLALKQYPSRRDDPRDRLATEAEALRLMERCGIDNVPRIVGADLSHGYALLTWIDGSQVRDVNEADVDAAAVFLKAIHDLRRMPEAGAQPMAAEACLAGVEIERQIDARLAFLQTLQSEQELIDFIDASLVPERQHRVVDARCAAAAAGLDFEANLPQEWRTLVPADFGFHNSLRRDDGSLAFVDFEYFGWDDPVKLTADILLHPGWPLPAPLRRRLRGLAASIYGDDPLFEPRLAAYLPLFGLRWALILLNEFLPERWQRRVLAGETMDWDDAKARQLACARSFLVALPQMVEA
jgi:Phosphotransferase enzyme family